MKITLTDTVVQSKNQLASTVNGEVVMMSVDQGRYFGLDKIGSRIWNLIAEPCTAGALCDRLTREFPVDRATCEADVLGFLDDLAARRLIDVA